MSESGNSPEAQPSGHEQERDEGTVIHNLHLLSLAFVEDVDRSGLDEATRTDLHAIRNKGTSMEGGKRYNSIAISYDTATGRICLPTDDAEFGAFSQIRSELVETGDLEPTFNGERWVRSDDIQRSILLHRRGDMPSLAQYSAAMAGEEGEVPDDRRIIPERVIPGESLDMVGLPEAWGQSEYTEKVHGDQVFLTTLRKFNQTYNPSAS